jgi:hypothetical protein
MKIVKKATALALSLLIVLSLAACGGAAPAAPAGDAPAAPAANAPAAEGAPYHIGIVTLSYAQTEDEIRGAEALLAELGSADDGGIIRHIVLPDNFAQELETVVSMISGLADDPLMKAIVVNPSVGGTAAAFQKIKETRSDILLMSGGPQDDPILTAEYADIVVDSDNVSRGYYDIARAKMMGADTFVHMTFPRHMSMQVLGHRRDIYKAVCADLGLTFADVTVPDPAGDVGTAGAQQQVFDMMPQLIDQYGTNAAYFTTNAALHEPLIKRVIEYGAIFVDTDDVSPLVGWPTALSVDLEQEAGDWPAILKKIEEAVVKVAEPGRMGGFAYSLIYSHSVGLVHLAQKLIDEGTPADMQAAVKEEYMALTPGCEWQANLYRDPSTGEYLDNFFVLGQDTYIFGKGYSGVMNEPVPEKYVNM